MELDQKELTLALSILKFQCDNNLVRNFNKTLKEIDSQLLDMGSNRQTIDVLNDLLVQLPNVIYIIKNIGILNDQEEVEKPIVKENNKVKTEVIEENEIIGRVNQMDVNLSSLPNEIVNRPIESPQTSKNHKSLADLQLHRRSSKRKLAERAKKTLENNSIIENQQLRDPKFEQYFYSSSEQSEEENGESENEQVQQQSSSYKNFVQKVEQVVEETVEIVPEVGEMSIDEIKKLAAKNAKRNKRIRYFSTDSDDESNNKKKRKKSNDKSPNKKSQENQTSKKRGRSPKAKEVIGQENEKESQEKSVGSIQKSVENYSQLKNLNTGEKLPEFDKQDSPKIDQQLTEDSVQNSEIIINFPDFSIKYIPNNEEINSGQEFQGFPDEQVQSKFCANNLNDAPKSDSQTGKSQHQSSSSFYKNCVQKVEQVVEKTNESNRFYLDKVTNSWIQNFSNKFKQMNDFQVIASNNGTQMNYFSNNFLPSLPPFQQPTIYPSNSIAQISDTPISKPMQKKSIGHVLEISSAKILAKIDADCVLIQKNMHDKNLVNNLIEACSKNAKILMEIKLDRFLISIVEMYWKIREQKVHGNIYDNQEIKQKVDWYLKDFNVSNSSDLRKSLVILLDEAFGDRTPYADFIFQELIFYTVREDGVPKAIGDCKETVEILNEVGFFEIVKNMTSSRMKFLEFVKKDIECNYEIDFWISD